MQKKRWIVYGRMFFEDHWANVKIKDLVPDMELYFDNMRCRQQKRWWGR